MRSRQIDTFVAQKLIPVQRNAVYKLLRNHKEGKLISDQWHKTGRKLLLEEDEEKKRKFGAEQKKWINNWDERN